MKNTLSFLVLLISSALFLAQSNKVNLKVTNSRTFKGAIDGIPITMFLKDEGMIDCDRNDVFVSGWYYYDKHKVKIPLDGYVGVTEPCEMKLYNFGKDHAKKVKKISEESTPISMDSIYSSVKNEELFVLDGCGDGKNLSKGVFKMKDKKLNVVINSNDLFLTHYYEYFKLPNGKTIDLMTIVEGYEGSKFYSMTEDKTENRILFYYDTISNSNACGFCGASERQGYHLLYFDKKWNLKKYERHPIADCREDIYFDKKIYENKSGVKYFIDKNEIKNRNAYYLVVDKATSRVRKEAK